MKISEILQLDCREKQNLKKLKQVADEMLPWVMDTIEEAEVAVHKMSKKYPVRLSYITPAVLDQPLDQPYYSFMLKNAESNEWLKTVYSVTIYEGMLKTALYLYGYIKKNFRKDGE